MEWMFRFYPLSLLSIMFCTSSLMHGLTTHFDTVLFYKSLLHHSLTLIILYASLPTPTALPLEASCFICSPVLFH